jgi:cytochrome bd-type quinol oxidase subunit 2
MAPDGNSTAFYFPLIALGVVYLVLFVVSRFFAAREEPETSERMADLAFGIGLLAAGYTVVLLIVAVITLPDLVVDLVRIVLVVGAFFAALLGVLFGIFELLIGRRTRIQPVAVAERSADSKSG